MSCSWSLSSSAVSRSISSALALGAARPGTGLFGVAAPGAEAGAVGTALGELAGADWAARSCSCCRRSSAVSGSSSSAVEGRTGRDGRGVTAGAAEAAGLGVDTGEAANGPGIDAMRFWVAGALAEGAGVGTCAAEGAALEEDAVVAREDRALRRDSADDGRGTADDEAVSRGAGVRDGAGVDGELVVDGAGVDAERAVAARGGASVDGAG